MKELLQLLVVGVVPLCTSAVVADTIEDDTFRAKFFALVATLSEPFYYGDSPQDYDIPINLPLGCDDFEAAYPESLRDFVASAQQLLAERQAAEIIRAGPDGGYEK